jgi:hypothetical protein
VLANEEIMRLSGTAHNGTLIPGTANQRIVYVARGNQTTSNQGGAIELWATPLNTITLAKVATVDSTGITLESGKVLTGNVTGKADTAGNADTVTNGVYTNGSYANPSWITSLAASKVGLGNVENTALSTSTHYIGTTSIQYNRASGAQTLAGVSISGNAGSVTNGVYTTDTGTVTNTMLAGSIANAKLTNSSVTVNGTAIALGASGTVTAAAGTLTGNTLASGVTASSLTSVGTLTNLSVTNTITGSISGNAGTATSAATLTTARNINGVSFNGSADITVTAAAGTLTGNTLASGVTASSLTSVGTLTNLAIAANGTITTPRIVINDGGIRTVSGGTTCTIDFATDSIILWTAPTGTAVITLSNYTAGARVKLIIAMTTSRDVTYGISSAANSSTGLDNWNGSGAGDIPLTNTAMHLEYTCISALAAGCYVAVTASE